jgi:hypothetical protein
VTKRTLYLLSVSDEFCPENAELSLDSPARPAAFVICPPDRPRRKMGAVRKRLLDRISEYLYSRAQKVETAEQRDAFTLALAIIGAVRHDEPQPFEAACYRAFGSTLKVYLKRRAERQWRQHQEYVQCIPDFDPHGQYSSIMEPNRQEARDAQVVPPVEIRGSEARPGRVHQMPQPAQPAVQKPLRSVPPGAAVKDA